MKKFFTAFAVLMCVVMVVSSSVFAADESDGVYTKDVVVTEEEYIRAVAEYEQMSYSEAKEKVEQKIINARVEPESVVQILRTAEKNVNGDFKLTCRTYLTVVRDNLTGDYLEILSVDSPHVDLAGPTVKTEYSGAVSDVIDGKKATISCNGTITYSVASTSVSVNLPGISVGTDVTGNVIYRYSVSTHFVFVV